MLQNWLKRLRKTRELKHFRNGWNWAAGELLCGTSSEEVEAWVDYGVHFDGNNPFDRGSLEACKAWYSKARP